MSHRLFIAYPVSQEAGQELARAQTELRTANPDAHVTWSRPGGFHITLAFLGEVEDKDVDNVKKITGEASKNARSFHYWLDRFDAFPNLNRPKILVAEVEEEGNKGGALQQNLFAALVANRFLCGDKPWHPHVTLGRNKTGERIFGLNEVEMRKVNWLVDKVELIESKLAPAGPVYTVVEEYKLI